MSESLGKPLAGKVALVTGAVRRIGRAIALRLAQDGAAVVIHTRVSEAEGRAVADEVAKLGVGSLLCLAEITDEVAVRAMIEQSRERFGRLDILVNNAAIRGQVPFLGAKSPASFWMALLSSPRRVCPLCCKAAKAAGSSISAARRPIPARWSAPMW